MKATFTDLGPQSIVADRLAAAAVTRIPKLLGDMNLAYSSGAVFIGVRQRELRLQTQFVVEEDYVVPAFVPGTPGAIELSPVFRFPEELNAVLGVRARFADGRWYWEGCNFFAMFGGQSHILPLPNVYNTSQVCMGSRYTCEKPSLDVLVDSVVSSFMAAPWNADLADDNRRRRARRMFRCNADGDPLPMEVSADTLIPVSHPNIEYYL